MVRGYRSVSTPKARTTTCRPRSSVRWCRATLGNSTAATVSGSSSSMSSDC